MEDVGLPGQDLEGELWGYLRGFMLDSGVIETPATLRGSIVLGMTVNK